MRRIVTKVLLIVFILISFIGCSKKPGDVIKDFYSAESWEDKKQFILDTEGIEAKDVYDELAEYKVQEITEVKKISKDSTIYKAKILRIKDGEEVKRFIHFLIVTTPKGEKIDFSAKLKINKVNLYDVVERKIKNEKIWLELEYNSGSVRVEGYTNLSLIVILKFDERNIGKMLTLKQELKRNLYSKYYLVEVSGVELKYYAALVFANRIISRDIFEGIEDQ